MKRGSECMRYSHQRERIFRAVAESCEHPTANMVYEQLKTDMPRLSLGTVYRNLNQLADAGRLKKIPLADGSCRFDKTTKAHSHIVCEQCGCVADVHLPSLKAIEETIANETDFSLRSYDVVLRGVCRNCRQLSGQNAG
ncbi:MAG: transcriptional repressor [Eubacteriales bacterium]|nr:transcriptional repressor [Eubacteriales bacterium]